MALKIALPLGEKMDVKDMAFSILTEEYPLKLIEITNMIKKRYAKSVTFQGVRKALMQMIKDGTVLRIGKEFSINKQWVLESKKFLDKLYLKLCSAEKAPKFDSIGGEVSVFVFDSVNEMVKTWEDLSDVWFKNFKDGDYNINCYQAAHSWEVLLHPDVEAKIMGQAHNKGINAYILCTSNTNLDKSLVKFHKRIGVKMVINTSANFSRAHYIGTYGDLILQATYPRKIVKMLDDYFKKYTSIDELDLAELSEIANTKVHVKMTAIKNIEMAKQINSSILAKINKTISA